MAAHHVAPYLAADDSTRKVYEKYMNPFYAECRAFGRLKEVGREDLAVKVYGYLKLDVVGRYKEQLLDLAYATGGVSRFIKRVQDEEKHIYRLFPAVPSEQNEPRYGILKDYIEEPAFPTDPSQCYVYYARHMKLFPWMLGNLHLLHRYGIVVTDLYLGQYVEGILVDLGRAVTVPHIDSPDFGLQPAWTCASLAVYDMYAFQEYVIGEDNRTLERAASHGWDVPEPYKGRVYDLDFQDHVPYLTDAERVTLYPYEQRPLLPLVDGSPTDEYAYAMTHYPQYDPAEFDWRTAASHYEWKKTVLREDVESEECWPWDEPGYEPVHLKQEEESSSDEGERGLYEPLLPITPNKVPTTEAYIKQEEESPSDRGAEGCSEHSLLPITPKKAPPTEVYIKREEESSDDDEAKGCSEHSFLITLKVSAWKGNDAIARSATTPPDWPAVVGGGTESGGRALKRKRSILELADGQVEEHQRKAADFQAASDQPRKRTRWDVKTRTAASSRPKRSVAKY